MNKLVPSNVVLTGQASVSQAIELAGTTLVMRQRRGD